MSNHLANRLYYNKGERDMILMRHEVTVVWPDGRRELKGINLVSFEPCWFPYGVPMKKKDNKITYMIVQKD